MDEQIRFRLAVQGAVQASQDVQRVGESIESLSARIGRMAHAAVGFEAMRRGISTAVAAARELAQAQVRFEKLEQVLRFSSARSVGEEMQFLQGTVRSLGLDFSSTANAYAGFAAAARGTALEGEKMQQVFSSVAKASAALNLGASETQGVLLALQQMISKGTVQAEELRGQLGERLPGAFQIAARSMGMTTQELGKLLETGGLVADDFLPKFAKQLETELGGAAEKSGQRLEASLNRTGNAWENLKQVTAKSGIGDAIAGQMNILTDAMDDVADSIRRAADSGGGFVAQLLAGGGAVARFLNTLNAFSYGVQDVGKKLEQAEAKLARLREDLEKAPDNLYLRGSVSDAQRLVEKLREANQEKEALLRIRGGPDEGDAERRRLGLGGYDPEDARFARQAASAKLLAEVMEKFATKTEKADRAVAEWRKRLADAFTPELEARIRASLNPPTVGLDDGARAVRTFTDEIAKTTRELQARITAGGKLSNAQKLELDLNEKLRGLDGKLVGGKAALSAADRQRAQDAIAVAVALQKKADEEEAELKRVIALARARADARTEEDKGIDAWLRAEDEARRAAVRSVEERIAALDDEQSAAVMAATQNIALAEAVELVAIARAQEKQARYTEGSEAWQTVEREIEARRRLAAQVRSKGDREAAAKAAEDAAQDWQRTADSIRGGLTDAFRRAFESGENFGTAFAKTIGNEIKTQIAAALADSMAGVVMGALFGNGNGSGGGGGGNGTNWLQAASGAGSLYSASGGGGLLGAIANSSYGQALATWWSSPVFAQSAASVAASSAGYATASNDLAFLVANGVPESEAASMLGGAAEAYTESSTLGLSSGATWGAYAGYAAMIYAAAMHQSSLYDKGFTGDDRMSGKFLYDISPNALDVKILSALGISDKWANILSGAVALNAVFGRAAPKITEQGLSGTLSAGDFEGQAYADWKAKGGLFRSNKYGTEYAELPEELGRWMDDAAASVYAGVQDFGKALGLPAEQLAGIGTQIRIALGDDIEKNKAAISTALGEYGDALVEGWAAAVAPLTQYGETTAQTIQRVGSAIVGVNDVLQTLGMQALATSVDGGKAALALQDLFGGLQGMQQAAGNYLQNFFSEAEQKDLLREQLRAKFADYGAELPDTREAFRAIVEGLDLTGAAGQRAFADLMGVADAFAAVSEPVRSAADAVREAADAAADIASERQRLQLELWRLQGDTAAIAAHERSQINASNLALYDQIRALEAHQAALQAAQAALEAATAAERERAQALAALWEGIDRGLLSGVQQAWSQASNLLGAERQRLQSEADRAASALEQQARQVEQRTAAFISSADGTLARLRGELAGDAGRAAALQQLQQMLASGSMDLDAARSAIDAASRVDTSGYATRLDYQREIAATAGLIGDVQATARQQQSRELAAIAAQQVQIEATLQAQLDVVDEQLEEARRSAQRLISIDTGVQTVAQALAALDRTIAATLAARGQADAATRASLPTGQWVASGSGEVWQAAGGAVAAREAANPTPEATLIRDITGASYTITDAQATVRDYLARDDISGLYAQAVGRGYDSAALDALMGWAPGTSLEEARRRGLPAFAVGSSYVPQTGPALVHEGERIVTAADNAELMRIMRGGGRDDSLAAEVRALREELQRLRAGQEVQTGMLHATAANTGAQARLLDDAINGGASIATRSE